MASKERAEKFIMMMCHYPDLSSAFVWLKICYIQVHLFYDILTFRVARAHFRDPRSLLALATIVVCVSSVRSRRLKVFGWKKEQARESETRKPRSFLRSLVLRRLVRVPREGARGGDSEIFVLSTSFKVHAIKVYDTSLITKTPVAFCHKTK